MRDQSIPSDAMGASRRRTSADLVHRGGGRAVGGEVDLHPWNSWHRQDDTAQGNLLGRSLLQRIVAHAETTYRFQEYRNLRSLSRSYFAVDVINCLDCDNSEERCVG